MNDDMRANVPASLPRQITVCGVTFTDEAKVDLGADTRVWVAHVRGAEIAIERSAVPGMGGQLLWSASVIFDDGVAGEFSNQAYHDTPAAAVWEVARAALRASERSVQVSCDLIAGARADGADEPAPVDVDPAERWCIAGVPRAGKTTLADTQAADYNGVVLHTDDTIPLGWSEASAEVATWFDRPGPWIIEGVAVPRALRKWLAANPEGKPCDHVLFLGTAREDLTGGQRTMAKGVITVFREIEAELAARGVSVSHG